MRQRNNIVIRSNSLLRSFVVSKIAQVDFPAQWPELLPTVLAAMPGGTDAQLHGALRILQDLVEDSLTDEQFFTVARDVIKACQDVALNEKRKDTHRALAVLVFRDCFDLMDIVKENHKKEVRAFAEEVLQGWLDFFKHVIETPLPPRVISEDLKSDSWYGPIALKVQVVKTLMKIKTVFRSLLLPHSAAFFQATWQELSRVEPAYKELFIDSDAQGRLEDIDGLPYTLDFLVLDELDLLNQLMRAPLVQKELEAAITAAGAVHTTQWVLDLMKLIAGYSRVTSEEEGLWEIDVSLYLAEETSVSSNYTARTACADLLIKLGEWLNLGAMEGLYAYSKALFSQPGDWRPQEAALYLFTVLLGDFQEMQKSISNEIAAAYAELVGYAINITDRPILRARGFLAGGALAQSYPQAIDLLDKAVDTMMNDESEIVQVACVKAIDGLIKAGASSSKQQAIVNAMEKFLAAKDLTDLNDADDLLVTLVETLRSAINMDIRIAISPECKAIDLLFELAKHGAASWQVTGMVNEAIQQIASTLTDPSSFSALCARVLPFILGAYDVANVTQDANLVTVCSYLGLYGVIGG